MIGARVYVPTHHEFGRVSDRMPMGWTGTALRVDLDDGRAVLARPDQVAAPDNIHPLHRATVRLLLAQEG